MCSGPWPIAENGAILSLKNVVARNSDHENAEIETGASFRFDAFRASGF
jgi:hypothetical protein